MATTNSLKFYRKSTAPSSPVAGAIWFNTTDKTIQIYTGTEWEKYAGNLKDATWSSDKKTLTITKHDGSSIALDFSDMASASGIASEIARLDKAITDGDAAAKGYADTQVGNASKTLIGTSGDAATASTIFGAKAHATAKADEAYNSAKEWANSAINALNATPSDSDDNEFVTVSLAQTAGKVNTVTVTTKNIASASELATVKATAEAAQTEAEVATAITGAIGKLNATVEGTSTHVDVEVVETNGKITTVNVTNKDIASAATLAEVKGKVDAFFAGADISETANKYKDTLKELQTYMTEDAAAAVTMTESIAANKSDIAKLAGAKVNNKNIAITQIGTDGATNLIVSGVTLDGTDVKITGYTKGTATDLAATDTINQALGKLEARVDAAAAGGVQSVNGKTGSITIGTGTKNGSISVGDANIAVYGLKSAAFTESTAYATAAQGSKADSAVQNVTVSAATGYDAKKEIVTVTKGTDNAINLAFNFANISEIKAGAYKSELPSGGPLVRAAVVSDVFETLDNNKADKATTLAGYGITDAYTKTEVDALLCWAEF